MWRTNGVRPNRTREQHAATRAAAKKGVCQGCRRSVTDQKWTEIRKGAFFMCPNCGKIMYPIVD